MSVYKLSVCPKNGGKKYDKMTFLISKSKKQKGKRQKAKSKKQKAKGKSKSKSKSKKQKAKAKSKKQKQITKFQKRHPERSRRANSNS